MGRAPCCDKAKVKRGPWSPEEDAKLKEYIEKQGTGGNWIALPQKAGLRRCGKSCRLRWLNYLRPNIRHGEFSDDEDRIICTLFASIGSRWSIIAAQLPGRTDNDIKNYWNTKLKKKLMGMVPPSHKRPYQATAYPSMSLFQASPPSSAVRGVHGSVSFGFDEKSSSEPATLYTYSYNISSPAGYEPISIPSSFLNNSTTTCSSNASATTLLQAQEDYVGSMLHVDQVKDSVLMFGGGGGEAASCSTSSFESFSNNNQISNGGDMEHDYASYLCNEVGDGGNSDGYCEKPNGFCGDQTSNSSIEYYSCLEEIKQLISTSTCNNLTFFN